jgi:hypothetical protein
MFPPRKGDHTVPAICPTNTARRILAALAIGSLLTGCEPEPGPTPPSPARSASAPVWAEPTELTALRSRPLRLPTLTAGDPCPVTKPTQLDPPPPPGHELGPGQALGHAPLFPDATFFVDGNRLQVRADPTSPGWYSAKTPWASRTGYLGWTFIRAARLDGPGQAQIDLHLADGTTQTSDALPVNVQADWQFWPGGTKVTSAGCYAYQIDGSGFTELIVFQTQIVP